MGHHRYYKVEDGLIGDFRAARRGMVESQLRRRGIYDGRVLAAMTDIRREEFVPEDAASEAYRDDPLQIGCGQTISQPYMTALMAQELELTGSENVLEVGAGSGYAAAVLGALARHVVTVEIVPELAEIARRNLRRAGRDGNVEVVEGDGSRGHGARAPYDAISVAAGAPEVPQALLDQLQDGGRLVIPVGGWLDQELRVITRHGSKFESRVSTPCRFVPLRGGEGWL
jgi:protein-L-isoaspartate(D-aspartate) O-methyltransferase